MAYEPTIWQTGDVVSSEKLNKLEEGVASGNEIFLVEANATQDENDSWSCELSHTYSEIVSAAQSGAIPILRLRAWHNGGYFYQFKFAFLENSSREGVFPDADRGFNANIYNISNFKTGNKTKLVIKWYKISIFDNYIDFRYYESEDSLS